jgi:hypothetical protein
LSDEINTKPELIFNVWAKTGKTVPENLGSGRINLGVLHSSKYEDKTFIDEKTK